MTRRTRVLLVQPRGVQEGFTRGGTRLPPLALLYIAAAIRDIAEVRLVDADALNLDDVGVTDSIGDWAPDLVGMTMSSPPLKVVLRFARHAKQATGARIIVGGPLPTAAPEKALEHDEVDLAAVGDGEPIMRDLCVALEDSQPPENVEGIVSKGLLTRRARLPSPRRALLSTVEQPAWDMLPDFGTYRSPDCIQTPVTIVEGQRGCPHACSFCSVPAISGKSRRSRSIASVLEEIDYLTGSRGVREISFVDPDFMANREYALAISKGIIAFGRHISWFCNARSLSVNEPVARKMQEAGCHLVYLGAESGDPTVLERIHKHQNLDQIQTSCRVLRNCGIQVSVGFIIGFPFDTDDSVRRTIEFAKSLRPAKFQFSLFNWFPGIAMQVPEGFGSVGFHPKTASPRWLKWQRIAYDELSAN